MTPFEAALAQGNAAVRASNGELLRFSPYVEGRYTTKASPDPNELPRELVGIFLTGPDRVHITDNTLGRELNSAIVSSPCNVILHAETLLIDGVVVLPKAGQRVRRLTKPTEPDYAITSVDPTGGGGYVARLVRVD